MAVHAPLTAKSIWSPWIELAIGEGLFKSEIRLQRKFPVRDRRNANQRIDPNQSTGRARGRAPMRDRAQRHAWYFFEWLELQTEPGPLITNQVLTS
jgi:hypothetical protein